MAMFSSASTPFKANIHLDKDDVVDYLRSALAKRGYKDVQVSFEFRHDNSNCLNILALSARITALHNGQQVIEDVSNDEMNAAVLAELVADGHSVEGVSVSHSNRLVWGAFTLIVPRKR